jgi:hypothetical protein
MLTYLSADRAFASAFRMGRRARFMGRRPLLRYHRQ